MAALVYLVRHARTDAADSRRFIGQSDQPLGPRGRESARLLADRLLRIPFDAIYTSDLERCLLVGRLVGEATDLPVHEDARLREIDVGLWDGLSPDEAEERYPENHREREHDLVHYRFPGGESFAELQQRSISAFNDILATNGQDRLLVITHKGVKRVLLCHLLGLPLEELFSIKQDFGQIDVVQISTEPNGTRRIRVETGGAKD
jgi:alpha-ribazole phosphatase